MEENKKSKLGLGIIIGILVTLVIGLTVFIVYDKVLSKENNNNEQVENNNDNNLVEEKELIETTDKEKLEKIVKLFNNQSIFNYVGNVVDIYNDLSINDTEKLQLTFASLQKKITEITIPQEKISINNKDTLLPFLRKQITVSEVENEYYNLFDEEIVNHQDIEDCPTYSYDSNNSVYYYSSECGGASGPSGPVSYINRYAYSDMEAYVYINLGYVEYEEFGEELASYKVYTDLNKNNLYKTENNVEVYSIDFNIINQSNYKDFSEYKYTFGKRDNGEYYFKSIEKIK